jgi:hypothetical protein
MNYLSRISERLEQVLGEMPELKDDDKFNPLELIKMDSRFTHTRDLVVQTIKHYDHSYPDIGTDEILAAIVNEVMEIIFPNMQNHKIEFP